MSHNIGRSNDAPWECGFSPLLCLLTYEGSCTASKNNRERGPGIPVYGSLVHNLLHFQFLICCKTWMCRRPGNIDVASFPVGMRLHLCCCTQICWYCTQGKVSKQSLCQDKTRQPPVSSQTHSLLNMEVMQARTSDQQD